MVHGPAQRFTYYYSYETARKIKQQQDEYCTKALSGNWEGLNEFPEDLQWEALVDVLRGRVKVKYDTSNGKFYIIMFQGPYALLRSN